MMGRAILSIAFILSAVAHAFASAARSLAARPRYSLHDYAYVLKSVLYVGMVLLSVCHYNSELAHNISYLGVAFCCWLLLISRARLPSEMIHRGRIIRHPPHDRIPPPSRPADKAGPRGRRKRRPR